MGKKIKVYSTPTCPFCQRAKAFLKERGVEFEVIDLGVDRDKVEEMVKISGQMSVPVIVIGDEVVVGFDQAKLERLLPDKAE